MMDLTFLLLITFIITFPLVEQGIPVNLPKAAAKEITSDSAHTITVDRGGSVYLDDVPMSLEELAGQVAQIAVSEPDMAVMVRADERIQYGKVVAVMRILHQANIVRMALVTEAE
jgi:biopolymer transport protein TolR